MFSFHKPKVYRSTSGCCICKAKSSSSRFTDSGKYEDDLMECFQLGERRTGEICNACVLLVKRWKKLPVGSGRHWRHVVDYRAGPGSKSLVRSKTRNKKRPKLKAEVRSASPGPDDDLSSDLSVLTVLSGPSSPSSVDQPKLSAALKRAKSPSPRKESSDAPIADSDFVDPTIWKRKKICCGVIFVGPGGIVIVDPRLLKPCSGGCNIQKRNVRPPIRGECRSSAAISGVATRGGSPSTIISDHFRTSPPISEAATLGSSSPCASPPMSDMANHEGSSPSTTIRDCRASPSISDLTNHGGSTPSSTITISDSSSDSGYDECSNPPVVAVAN